MKNATGDPIQILMVDDSSTDIFFARSAFKEADIADSISVVPDGVEALSYLRKEGSYTNATSPNLVLLDLNMPRKNGKDTLRELKGDPILKALPVIILTTSEDDVDIHEAYSSYANCYIAKPRDYRGYGDIVKTIKDFWLQLAKLPAAVG